MNLADLHILALDCQATGASPDKGHLLEIGWAVCRAAEDADPLTLPVESALVRLPAGVDIPPAVQRVTGISKESPGKTLPASSAWKKIADLARQMTAANCPDRCLTVIHFARFETPFLLHLHAQYQPESAFPLRIVCTHQIARRLLPGLPRKGLRAVAGFFGHPVPPLRRAADHAVATAVIWRHLVKLLADEHDIATLDQLTEWLETTAPPSRPDRQYPMDQKVRRHLPDKPGIYRMRRSNGDLLYIGKATSLKQRVNSYFRQKAVKAEHILEMLSQAADLDVERTGSALEAAVRESDEIKQHAPPYNVALQIGARKLVFLSSDLRKGATRPDQTHCIGPLPDGSLTAALQALGEWHGDHSFGQGDHLPTIGSALVAMPEAYAPPPDCLAEGLGLFSRTHRSWLARPQPLRLLTGLGVSLWRDRLAALEAARRQPAPEGTDDDLETPDEPVWTPEAVSRAVEHVIMNSALLIRRARWLCLLSESTLAWERRAASNGDKNVLRLESGAAVRWQRLAVKDNLPSPLGCDRPMGQRQKRFDITTYERLRVVTTELRRLLAEHRSVDIQLKPTARLNQRHLATILPWV